MGEAKDEGLEGGPEDEEEEWIWSEEHQRHYRQIGVDDDGNPVCEWDIGQRSQE